MRNGVPSLFHRDAHTADIGVDLQAYLPACEFELGALLIGHDDDLGPFADSATAARGSVDARHISGTANVANCALEIGLGSAEGEAARNAADRNGIVAAMKGQRALASRATDEEGRLVDGEADRTAIGMRGTGEAYSRGGDDGKRG
ncbi:hypothetical protein RHSP_08841 [Rhizobium freirei PRF 81]|uniref:Uncharacterized protein n=1 Tax=Rhizobium freirei PRF 81 TaxID=363754 RepID=N6U1M5_9HYPH|nr:hypothetical protein RHSP_08841 [Rhizobium freirei PRF 81]